MPDPTKASVLVEQARKVLRIFDENIYVTQVGLGREFYQSVIDRDEAQSAEIAELTAARDQYAGLYMDRVGQLNEANCELAAAQDRVGRLTEALRPFAEFRHKVSWRPDLGGGIIESIDGRVLPAKHEFEAARQALADTAQGRE